MGTRSRIGIEDGETGRVRSIYCHWDGYPSHNGRILVEHYSDRTKLEELIALGSISSLGEEIGEKHDFDGPRHETWTLAYGRDRGEADVEAVESADAEAYYALAQEGWEEYAYLYRQGAWFVAKIGGGAGPFLVSASDPEGTAPSRWVRVEAVLGGIDVVA